MEETEPMQTQKNGGKNFLEDGWLVELNYKD